MRKLLSSLLLIALPFAACADAPPVQVEVNKGTIVRLTRAATAVVVADPEIADIQIISPKVVYVHARKIGETSVIAIDSGDETILDTVIEVTHNISKLNRTLKQVMPSADVNFKSTDNGLVMEGFVDSPIESKRVQELAVTFLGKEQALVNMLNTAGSDQVLLQVKVAEVARTELKRFGIHMENLFTPGKFVFSLAQGRDFLTGGSVIRNGTDSSIFASYTGNRGSVQGVLDALEQNGLVSVLAEPSLTTTSGKTANFLAGGEFPIPLVDSDGKVTVEYKPFGISLNFTPAVLSKDKISLSVAPEVSNISSLNELNLGETTAFAIPSIQTRRAETTVELASGQTFAIAGLFKNDRNNSIDKFPGLGDVPVLGALFRSHEFQNDQTELVILVTPYIVRPATEPKLATPIDGYTPPTDMQRLLLGKLYQQQGVDAAADAPKLEGQAGYILE